MDNSENIQKYESEILAIIDEERLFNIISIFAYYKGCNRATFYNNGLDKLDSIKNALENNKVLTCQSLKQKWYKSENPTLQLALFKTICTEEERRALSMTNSDITSNGQTLQQIVVQNHQAAEDINKL